MALAKNLGLTDKVVSERHYWASQKKMTAGEAAAFISKKTKVKILAKDLHIICKEILHFEMEWHHSGFYKNYSGKKQMGKTYFIDSEHVNQIIDDFDRIYKELLAFKESLVYAIAWSWIEQNGKNVKKLFVFKGKRCDLPEHAIICTKAEYNRAKRCDGRIYTGWEEPSLEDFS